MTLSIRGMLADEIQCMLQNSYKEYYNLKGDAHTLRFHYLETLAASLAEKGKGSQESTLKSLRARETQWQAARKL
jgi:hypothetical protein